MTLLDAQRVLRTHRALLAERHYQDVPGAFERETLEALRLAEVALEVCSQVGQLVERLAHAIVRPLELPELPRGGLCGYQRGGVNGGK